MARVTRREPKFAWVLEARRVGGEPFSGELTPSQAESLWANGSTLELSSYRAKVLPFPATVARTHDLRGQGYTHIKFAVPQGYLPIYLNL